MKHAECYRAIEKELERRGIDFTIHGLPGAEDIVHFEEYWITDLSDRIKIFPAIVDADRADDLSGTIVRAVEAHADDGTEAYTVVLCGEGWTGERVETLRRQVEAPVKTNIQVSVETLQSFTSRP